MGDLIRLQDRRAARAAQRPPAVAPVTFAFDTASPWTYLAAERVERRFARLRWIPVCHRELRTPGDGFGGRASRMLAERRAAELGMPLVWPEEGPARTPAATRVATLAAERGSAPAFVLAAGRLAYCGGYDLDDPEVLAEAAAAGGLCLDEALVAARDPARDRAPAQAGRELVADGARGLPVLRLGARLFAVEHSLAEAFAAAESRSPRRGDEDAYGRA